MNNNTISSESQYWYDALYRLVKATGREKGGLNSAPTSADIGISYPVPYSNAPDDMVNYTQTFEYDQLGNIQNMGSVNKWTRDYVYDTATNRLLKHDEQQTVNDYAYDAHGNMLFMPGISMMNWDYKDELQQTTSGTVTTYYCYDIKGERTRKVTEKQGGIREERLYLGNYEVYRQYEGNNTKTERTTLHINDDDKRVAIADSLLIDNYNELPLPETTIRYQCDNHLGSSCLELNDSAAVISYEEYHPFGTSSYRLGTNDSEVKLKRYRYVGKERDEETGLYYYGARYYAAWIARFVSVDPLQHEYPELTPFQYASNEPVAFIDLDGLEKAKPKRNEIKKSSDFLISNYNKVFKYLMKNNSQFSQMLSKYSTLGFNLSLGTDDSKLGTDNYGNKSGGKTDYSYRTVIPANAKEKEYTSSVQTVINFDSKRSTGNITLWHLYIIIHEITHANEPLDPSIAKKEPKEAKNDPLKYTPKRDHIAFTALIDKTIKAFTELSTDLNLNWTKDQIKEVSLFGAENSQMFHDYINELVKKNNSDSKNKKTTYQEEKDKYTERVNNLLSQTIILPN